MPSFRHRRPGQGLAVGPQRQAVTGLLATSLVDPTLGKLYIYMYMYMYRYTYMFMYMYKDVG